MIPMKAKKIPIKKPELEPDDRQAGGHQGAIDQANTNWP